MCRSKRIRCIITSTNYEETGCENCRHSVRLCDLISENYRPQAEQALIKAIESAEAPPDGLSPSSREPSHPPQISSAPPAPQPQMQFSPNPQYPQQYAPGQYQQYPNQQYLPVASPIIKQEPGQPQSQPANFQHGYTVPMPQGQMNYANYQMYPPMPPATRPPNLAITPAMPQFMPYPPGTAMYRDSQPPPQTLPGNQTPQTPQSPLGHHDHAPHAHQDHQAPPAVQTGQEPSDLEAPSKRLRVDKVDKVDSIDAQYLKDRYNFNLCLAGSKYTSVRIPTNDDETGQETYQQKTDALNRISQVRSTRSRNGLGVIKSRHLGEFLTQIEAFTLSDREYHITKEQERQLLEVYFEKINLLFPILDETKFWASYNEDSQSTLVIYCIILVVSRDIRTRPILENVFNLTTDDWEDINEVYSTRLLEFLDKLELKIRQLLLVLSDLGDNDKLNRLVIHLLLSMNFSNNKFGNEQSNHDLYSSISLAFSLLIHRSLFHQSLVKAGKVVESNYLKRLWWVLFVFDRFNAVLNSKAFFIKRFDFDITYPNDDSLSPNDKMFQGLLDNIKVLEEVIFMIYQPNQNLKKVKQYEDLIHLELNNLNEERFKTHLETVSKQCAGGSKRPLIFSCQLFMLKKFINNLIIVIINNFTIIFTKTQHQLSDISIKCCSNVINHLALMKRCNIDFDIMLCIPIVPSLLSLFLSIILKYKLKIIFLIKFNRLKERPDVDANKINLLNSMFENYHLILLQNFNNWWFIKQILKTVQVFVNGTRNPNRAFDDVDDSKLLQNDDKQGKNQKKKSKLDISLIVDQEDTVVPPVVSISSPTFYSTALLQDGLFEGGQKETQRNKRVTQQHMDSSSTGDPIQSEPPESLTMEEGSQEPPENRISTPIGAQEEITTQVMDHNGDILKQVEDKRILEMINEDFFAAGNMSEFVTEDPLLKDFFVSM